MSLVLGVIMRYIVKNSFLHDIRERIDLREKTLLHQKMLEFHQGQRLCFVIGENQSNFGEVNGVQRELLFVDLARLKHKDLHKIVDFAVEPL
jgi:hypothetical protein